MKQHQANCFSMTVCEPEPMNDYAFIPLDVCIVMHAHDKLYLKPNFLYIFCGHTVIMLVHGTLILYYTHRSIALLATTSRWYSLLEAGKEICAIFL